MEKPKISHKATPLRGIAINIKTTLQKQHQPQRPIARTLRLMGFIKYVRQPNRKPGSVLNDDLSRPCVAARL